VSEFDTFGATMRTLRGFLDATHELATIVRNIILPNPDKL
jgi:transaldolase